MRVLTRADFKPDTAGEEAWNLYTAAVARAPMDPDIARRAVQYGIRVLMVRAWKAHKDRIQQEMMGAQGEELAQLAVEMRIAAQRIEDAMGYTLPQSL